MPIGKIKMDKISPKPGGPRKPGKPKPGPGRPRPVGPKLPGKPGAAIKPKPGKKPGRSLIDEFKDYAENAKKKPSKKVAKTIGYAVTALQNRIKGGKKGPGKVGRIAR